MNTVNSVSVLSFHDNIVNRYFSFRNYFSMHVCTYLFGIFKLVSHNKIVEKKSLNKGKALKKINITQDYRKVPLQNLKLQFPTTNFRANSYYKIENKDLYYKGWSSPEALIYFRFLNINQSVVVCVVLCRLLSSCPFSLGHCIVCPTLIYD